ncbi:hypothetical protein QEG98_42055 (plasmid) [Myxococcus sp. MxC21-1]|uniref:hypothetical protein n=1 Tax=Myxococcus sp. MxC21-1 TaxID=3041439 RepID=UPI00292E0F76|nr:hypothetical protein [Myxococcus sp. MxC21-1]WNZ66205.1 hypothetical protein QEG98_42055 [Myxococcus sp. MxC21-1]
MRLVRPRDELVVGFPSATIEFLPPPAAQFSAAPGAGELEDALDALGWAYCGWDVRRGFVAERRSYRREEFHPPEHDRLAAHSPNELLDLVRARVRAVLADQSGVLV